MLYLGRQTMRLLREIDVDRECERDPGSSSGGIYSFNGWIRFDIF